MNITYWDRVYAKKPQSYWEHKAWKSPPSCYVPGWAGDKTHQCYLKFDKWYNRPRAAHRLYWRLHNNGR